MYKTWRWSKIVTIIPTFTFIHHVSASHGATLTFLVVVPTQGLSRECFQSEKLLRSF